LTTFQEVRDVKIAFIAYHELFNGDTSPITTEIQKIKSEKLAEFIVIYAHWGDEYLQKIHPRPQKKAHAFIDAGADIVIGHHPHVVQPMEIYNDKYIFYSLGNFVFDQVLGKSVRTRLGLGLEFICENNCENKKINYTLFPLIADKNKTYNFAVELMKKENQEKFISWFKRISK
ncbi:TPA: CapA family protein, partial [Candidatus Gracilibacteria bacterium]|nr:CapA family protein [Candidatus Gracilibacteria bacterium]